MIQLRMNNLNKQPVFGLADFQYGLALLYPFQTLA